MNTNTEDFRAALAAQVASNTAAGITGEIRINDDSTRVREARYDPAEFDRAPVGTPLDGATDIHGVPIGYSKALEADASTVLVTYNGVPMRLSQALELGLCTRAQLGAVTQPSPAGTPSPTQTTQPADEGDTAGAAEHADAVDALRAPWTDSEDIANLNAFQDAAERSGFSLEVAARDWLADAADGSTATIEAMARATGHTVETVNEVVQEMETFVIGQLVDLAGEEAVAEAMAAPGWTTAALAMISSGSLLPGARFVAQNIERQKARG